MHIGYHPPTELCRFGLNCQFLNYTKCFWLYGFSSGVRNLVPHVCPGACFMSYFLPFLRPICIVCNLIYGFQFRWQNFRLLIFSFICIAHRLYSLRYLYSLKSIIRATKSRRRRWAGHVVRMGEKKNAYRLLVGKPEEKSPLGRPTRG
jgi:hypothetical protein